MTMTKDKTFPMSAKVVEIRPSTRGQFLPRTKPWDYDNYQVILEADEGAVHRGNVNPNNCSTLKKGVDSSGNLVAFSELRPGDVIVGYKTFASDPALSAKLNLSDPENVINTNFGFVLLSRGEDKTKEEV